MLARDKVSEDRNNIKKVTERKLAISVKYENGLDLEKILNELNEFNPQFDNYVFRNDYKNIGDRIISYIEEI